MFCLKNNLGRVSRETHLLMCDSEMSVMKIINNSPENVKLLVRCGTLKGISKFLKF